MSAQVHYPLSKEEYGSSMWKVMHSYTANLPEHVSRNDKRKFRDTLLDLIDKFPCLDCKDHGLAYIKEHQPKGKSRQDYFNYLCDFHNHVNRETGKPVVDCNSMLTTSVPDTSCPTCSHTLTKPPKIEANQKSASISNNSKINQIIDYRLNQQMGDIKNVSKQIVEKMSVNAGVPIPEMTFSDHTPCSDPNNSCTHLTVNPTTKALVPGTKIHFNVNQYSPRTAVHETIQYIRKAKGLSNFDDEESVEKEARGIIARDFPLDTRHRLHTTANITEVRDTPLDSNYFRNRVAKRLETVNESLPYFSKYYYPSKVHKKEQPAPNTYPTVTYSDGRPVYPQIPTQEQIPEKQEPQSATEGFTSMLDPIYAPFANWLGLKPRDVNDAHTPALLANGAIVLAESNLNRFGSMAFSLLASITTLAIGTLAKENLGFADKKLLVGLGGAFLWNSGLRYIVNPKIHEEVMSQAMDFGQSLSGMDFEAMVGSVTADHPKEMDPEQIMLKGGQPGSAFPKNLHRNISSPVGGGTQKISSRRTKEIDPSDIYDDPDSTISSQGTFRRSDPFFPSM